MTGIQRCTVKRTDVENRQAAVDRRNVVNHRSAVNHCPAGKKYYEQSEKESGEYRESGRSGFLSVAENRGKYRSSTLDLRIESALIGPIT